jgi:excinuclease UvrABC nuclease subunit
MSVEIKRINPFTLPSIGIEQRTKLPDLSAVYFVIFGDEIIYIGKSVNLYQRWLAHHR